MKSIRLLAVAGMVVVAACGSEDPKARSSTTSTMTGGLVTVGKPMFESNVKYDTLEALVNRGAVAPVIRDFRCSWTGGDTVADCIGRGYDNAAEQSKCGYELLPCGAFDLSVHAECADDSGRNCQVEMELTSRDP